MISKTYTENTLSRLDRMFQTATSQQKEIYYAKLGVLELCGWIESSFDEIVLGYANRCLRNNANKTFVKKQIIKPNYGFEYNKNVRPMLMKILGLVNLEKIEKKLETNGKITQLTSLLENLKDARNKAAHTFTKGTTITYDAPSVSKANFISLYSLIIELDNEIRDFYG